NRDAAMGAWRQILTLDDRDGQALDALERLYGEAHDHRALVDILHTKIDLASDPAVRRALRFAAAHEHDHNLNDAFEAISHYKAALEENPEDAGALEALDAIYSRERSWVDLVEVLDRRTALERDPYHRADLAFRAARLVEKEEREADQAIERYRKILA